MTGQIKTSLQASFVKHALNFKRPSGTSRGILNRKNTWFLIVQDENNPRIQGIGECGPLKGLSVDDREDFEVKLQEVCEPIDDHERWLKTGLEAFPSIKFGLETALLDLSNNGERILFPSEFTQGTKSIKINGLIWMGDFDFMKAQIDQKLEEGYDCIKLKIGAINFDQELELIKHIRNKYPPDRLEIRVDANGAFSPEEAPAKLEKLSRYKIHSIEQPIRAGQWDKMAELTHSSPIPIALDEELIGHHTFDERQELIRVIQPQYIILKPTLLGGFQESKAWIDLAEENNIGWWTTSALESNIGLNAIAQWTYMLKNPMPQGLGTGQLFTNNITSPLQLKGDQLYYQLQQEWDLKLLFQNA